MKLFSRLAARLIALWQTEFPLNLRTVLFYFFTGSLLSFPFGLLIVIHWELFAAPLWTAPIYAVAVIVSFLILPFWSAFAMRGQPLLQAIGAAVSVLAFGFVAFLCLSRFAVFGN